ncbi:TIGR03546 family protein [Stieleria mannarensis]|uniref:TIGR03546 family protein n=1 Tax=Stieleria mannarensis TaxID=2755585 RepID=UPI0015FF5C73|nr:TIGR03546 family protein [Rhodopirellula sp. JC639]
MVIFSLKLINNVRKAIAGRRYPHQLAGGVALGVLLGIIPHGNLLALIVLLTLVCFKVNHALMGVVAIAASFLATRLDSYSHLVGEHLLTHPTGNEWARQAWALPVVPWTDLNNTVVLGSFVIGTVSVLPIFALCLPLFRLLAPATPPEESLTEESDAPLEASATSASIAGTKRRDEQHDLSTHQRSSAAEVAETDKTPDSAALLIDQQDAVPPPRFAAAGPDTTAPRRPRPSTDPIDDLLATEPIFIPIETAHQHMAHQHRDDAATDNASIGADSDTGNKLPSNEQMVSVETRIDVIRMKDFRDDEAKPDGSEGDAADRASKPPTDEALNYLLRQLRHSQERKAAG